MKSTQILKYVACKFDQSFEKYHILKEKKKKNMSFCVKVV